MPCRDEQYTPTDIAILAAQKAVEEKKDGFNTALSLLLARNNHLAEMMCTYCRRLERTKKPIPKEFRAWWKQHKAFDKKEGR